MKNEKKTVLHILSSGDTGGIEILCKEYAKYSQNNNIFLFPWRVGSITNAMEEAGANVIRLNASQKEFFKTYSNIKRICIKNKVKSIVIHHNAPALLLYTPFLKKKFPNIKVYMYAHSAAKNMFWKSNRIKFMYYKPIVIWASKKVDYIIAISEYVKSTVIEEMKVNPNKIRVIYNGVDLRTYKPSTIEEDNISKFVYVGRLVKEKGVENIVRAMKILPQDMSWHLTIAGDGPEKKNIECLIEKLNLKDKISMIGNCEEVPKLLSQSGIFLHLPNCEEGFGITVIEAMATGLICICGASGAIPEIILNKVDGLLVENSNYKEMADCIVELFNNTNKSKIAELKKAAVNKATYFSIDKFVKKLDKTVR